jgi:alkylhydroperoxidase/carboxymuconolactone decarboxylase family protein YurZ
MVTVHDLRRLAADAAATAGDPLDPLDVRLIRLGVAVSVTSLDKGAIEAAVAGALTAGATTDQIQEIVSLVSGLGVHSLMASSRIIVDQARKAGRQLDERFSDDQQRLWDKHVGTDPFWVTFESELPGFLRAMLLLSSDQFVAFFDYCAVPWKGRYVRAKVKELTAMACDATPAHRFLPGFRVHLANAVALGAGRVAIEAALEIAAAAPPHRGTP